VTESPENRSVINVSDIDEFLAARFLEGGGGPLSFSVRREGRDGGISISGAEFASEPGGGEGVDFELSTCECRGLDPDDAGVYIGRPVYTSSASSSSLHAPDTSLPSTVLSNSPGTRGVSG
jgi:hypothetical protein